MASGHTVSVACLALFASGCLTLSEAQTTSQITSNVSNQDLAYLSAVYQLLQFNLSTCGDLAPSDIPSYAASITTKVCGASAKYKSALEDLARKMGVTLPNALDFDHQAEANALSAAKSNQSFTSSLLSPLTPNYAYGQYSSQIARFLSYQVASHETALADFQSEGRFGSNPDIKATAQKYEPLLQQNLIDLQVAFIHAQGNGGASAK